MAVEPRRVDGPTPNGGAYAILYTHDDGSREIVEFNDRDEQIFRTYSPVSRSSKHAPQER